MSTIFERLDALEAQVNGLITDFNYMGRKIVNLEETVEELINAQEDTGWITLPLASGLSQHTMRLIHLSIER